MSKKPAAYLLGAVIAVAAAFGAHFEGQRLTAYQDTGGVWTLCDGHTAGVRPGDTATSALATVQRCITTPLSLGQLAAFTDAAYNAGPAIVCGSTLQRKANAGDVAGACAELPRWVYAGGKVLPGLVARREAERKLCMGEPL
jgi:lysozyme